MDLIKKISSALGLFFIFSFSVQAANGITFVNNTGDRFKVTLNGLPGQDIPAQGKYIPYAIVKMLCANSKNCHADFKLADGTVVGWAELNSQTGAMNDYEAYAPYSVDLEFEDVALTKATFNKN